MRAVLRYLHSPDVHDLKAFRPEESDNFAFLVQIMVGRDTGPGEESFDVLVCTPRWLLENHSNEEILTGRHKLIVFSYDYQRLHRFIENAVSEASGSNWQEVASRLARFGHWEFEDYVPGKP